MVAVTEGITRSDREARQILLTKPWSAGGLEAYTRLRGRAQGAILLDSTLVGERSRFSIIGLDPVLRLTADAAGAGIEVEGGRRTFEDPLAFLAGTLGRTWMTPTPATPFPAGFAGVIGYDFARFLERIGNSARDDLATPWLDLYLFDTTATVDHLAGTITISATDIPGFSIEAAAKRVEAVLRRLSTPVPSHPFSPSGPVAANMTRGAFEGMVERAKGQIAEGEIFQANLSLRFEVEASGDPVGLYGKLSAVNPSGFAGIFESPAQRIVSSSPERLVRLAGDQLETRPIAGTRGRGMDAAEDEALVGELLASEKERAEHTMLVDLERNDLGRISEFGSVAVEEFMTVERYSHVSHIVSLVVGRKRPGVGVAEILGAMFPGGTITGAPKLRSMEVIDALEPTRRGPYTGSMGYFSLTGDLDLNILIRSILLKDGRAYVQAGAGIVADSEPGREYEESVAKARAPLAALGVEP